MFIQLGIINSKLIIPLLYPIFYQIRFGINQSNNGFYEIFINYLSYSLAGIVFLIVRYNTNKTEKIKNSTSKPNRDSNLSNDKILIDPYDDLKNNVIIQEIQEEKLKKEKKELYQLKICVISLAVLNLIPMSYEIISHNTLQDVLDFKVRENSSMFSIIIFYTLFSRIFLGYKIYNHQILALGIILICMIFFFILYILENSISFDTIINILFFSLIFGFYALYNVLGKKIFDSFIISPYYFMFSIGIVSLAIILPFEIISYIIDSDWEYNGIIRQITGNFSLTFLLELITSAVAGLFWVGGIWLTVYYFSPCHIIISESLSIILSSIIENSFKEYSLAKKIVFYINYGVILFCSLIYNEVVIIKNEKISKDTKIYIIRRQNNEVRLIEEAKKMENIFI